eukprot:m.87013 g.87013  ORF g.87013 m.87013 type:complete len:387 (+) comp9685_c1_seq1:70-1230(+)
MAAREERNQDATVYVGQLDDQVTEPLLWELFVQAGPVVNVHMPKDRITSAHQNFGFVEFLSEDDADYAVKILNMIKLYGKPIRVNKASSDVRSNDVGANLFVGNLDPAVDEKLLYDTFSAFGVILNPPKIMRDQETGNSKGFAFVNYASFEASDAAIEAMNGQFLHNRAITISYAYKRDTKGERHGSAAERLLAAQNPIIKETQPHQHFADSAPGAAPPPPPPPGAGPPTGPPQPNGSAPPNANNNNSGGGGGGGLMGHAPPMHAGGPPPGFHGGPPPGMPPGPPPGPPMHGGMHGGPPRGYGGPPPGMPPPMHGGGGGFRLPPPGFPPGGHRMPPPGFPPGMMPHPGMMRPPPGMPPPGMGGPPPGMPPRPPHMPPPGMPPPVSG